MEAFGRNIVGLNKVVNGRNTSPLKWSTSPAASFLTFQDCYEKVLKPQAKYAGTNAAQAAEFYKADGAYDFLVALETTLATSKCSLICKTPLFPLTRPLAEGMPVEECMGAAIKVTLGHAESVAWTLTLTGGITLATLLCVCGVCTPYSNADNSIAAMAQDKMQELGLMSDTDDDEDKENQSTVVINTGRGKDKEIKALAKGEADIDDKSQ